MYIIELIWIFVQ